MSTLALEAFEGLSKNRIFDGIDADLLEKIKPEVRVVRIEAGKVIFHEGDEGDQLYLVGEGSVKISKSGRGGEQETLSYIKPGNFFGEMALLDGQPRSAMATAVEETLLGAVDEPTFRHILELAPSRLQMNFLRSVTERLRSVNNHFINEVMRSERLSLVGSMANGIIHDLKNPICIIRGCCELIANTNADPRTLQLTKMMDDAVDGMLSMTQELLDYARGQSELHLETVSMWRLLDELNTQALCLLPGQNIRFIRDFRYEGNLHVDLHRFLRVLCNLIKNAREAMPSGGILTLTTDRIQDEVVLRLEDTGIGMPAKILATVFEPFVTHGKAHGTGLGMAIAKSVVDAHHGRITVTSAEGRGTAVEIRLPQPASPPDESRSRS